jgi:TPR repeat protein
LLSGRRGAADDSTEAARRYFTRGLATLEQLAAKGDAFAGGLVARFHQMGSGVNRDSARAVTLARPAAAAGSAEAMRVLGWAYPLGEGVEMDATQTATWWRRGAEGGNSYCMMWYSQMLFKGQAGRPDSVAGYTWLERSGTKGNSWAIVDLGKFYDASAYGIPRDEKKAAFWKRKVLAFGNEEARGWLIAHHMLE